MKKNFFILSNSKTLLSIVFTGYISKCIYWSFSEFDRRCKEGEIIDDLPPSYNGKTLDISPNVAEVTS